MIRGIHHISIHTPDLDRAVRFYTEAFGFQPISNTEYTTNNNPLFDQVCGVTGCDVRHRMLKTNNLFLELWQFLAPVGRPVDPRNPNDHGYTHMCVEVSDIDEEYVRLKAAGMTFAHPTPVQVMSHCKAVYGRDPDGNIIEIQQLLPGTRADFDSLVAK